MIEERANAKINLYLKVVAKRPDGFHELETLFCEIDLADELRYQPGGPPFGLEISGADLTAGEDNLIVKAVRIFAEHYGGPVGGQVHLTKRIPMGAGLGGGSSDAAAMLRILNRAYQTDYDVATLLELAGKLGSDVPFFIEGGCQLGRGRGELLRSCALPTVSKRGFLACLPVHMPTAQVFGAFQMKELKLGDDPVLVGENDLLPAARSVSPQFDRIWQTLKDRLTNETLFMTGSGSSLVWLTEELAVPADVMSLLAKHEGFWVPFTLLGETENRSTG